jgi:parallel beta-helix repeat protein
MMNKKIYWALCFLLMALSLIIPSNSAKAVVDTYYISPTGSDSGAGTETSPWLTIQKALSVMDAGDTLYARGGTYNNQYGITLSNKTGTSTAPITIAAYPGETPIFSDVWPSSVLHTFMEIRNSSWVVLDGLTIQNYSKNGLWIGNDTAGQTNHNITVQNCTIQNIGTSTAQHHGIYLSADNYDTTIQNNKISNVTSAGIHMFHVPGGNNFKIYNNVISNNREGIIVDDAHNNTDIINNTFYNNTRNIDISNYNGNTITNTRIYNNISYNNVSGQIGLWVWSGNTGQVTEDNNLWYDTTKSTPINWGGTVSTPVYMSVADLRAATTNADHSIQVDPLFVNTGTDPLKLQSNSQAIDSGTSVGAPNEDILHIQRPSGAGYDMGAYEYPAGTSTGGVNRALNKTHTTNGTLTGTTLVSYATDGDHSNTANYTSYDAKTGGVYIQIDLGASYNLNKVNLWHYYGDTRAYHDVIVQLSNDSTFATKTTVFNNDTDNSSSQGTGTDAEYTETSAGKTITFPAVNARYVRLWTNGNTLNGFNNYVEVEVWDTPNRALNKTHTSNGTLTGTTLVSYATDGDHSNTANYTSYDAKTGGVYIQFDLGASYNLREVNLWHYYGDTRAYHDVIVQLSNDSTFATKTTVFNNDTNNSASQGTGTDAEYTETSAGKSITFPAVNARYVRLWTNGNTVNGFNNYVEVEAFE